MTIDTPSTQRRPEEASPPSLARAWVIALAVGGLALLASVLLTAAGAETRPTAVDFVLATVLWSLVSLVVLVPALRGTPRNGWASAGLGVALLAVYAIVSGLPRPGFVADLQWNWWGHSLFLIAALTVLTLWRRDGLRAAGVTSPPTRRWWLPTLILVLVIGTLAFFGGMSQGQPTVETLLFQWTMPGLTEETFFRGLLLLLANEAFGRPWRLLGARFGWGLVWTSLLFGLVHAGTWPFAGDAFQVEPFLFAFVIGLVLCWLRERTGSIWPSVLLHNVSNGMSWVGAATVAGLA
jgi:membrane protease YdiL (CAAX protease family)